MTSLVCQVETPHWYSANVHVKMHKFILFSGYRGSHDSGFSQSVRLSNVSSVHDSSIVGPPVPHRGPPDYLDMTGQAKLEPPTTRTANG